MSAVEAPPVVVEQAPTEPVVPSEPAPSPVEGEQQEQPEGNGSAIPRADTREEIEAFLASASPQAREAYERDVEARGEQRAQTRKKETDTAVAGRLEAWKPYVDNLPNAQAYVTAQMAKVKGGDLLDDPKLFEQASQQLNVGTLGKVVLENEAYVQPLLDKYLPELTKDEADKLDKPLYKFGQTGMAKEAVNAIFEVAVERAKKEAFDAGVKKGEGNLAARESLLEKYEKVAKIKQEGAGVSPNGKPSSVADERARLGAEIAAFDPTKMTHADAQAKLAELKAKEAALTRS